MSTLMLLDIIRLELISRLIRKRRLSEPDPKTSVTRDIPEVVGIDHIYITVSDMARSEEFYDRALRALGFRKNHFIIKGERHIQYCNRQLGYVLRPAKLATHHARYAPGLHHLCFRVESVADVLAVAQNLRAAGVEVTDPRYFPEYAADYFATFFTDPDGIRLEVTNYRQERRERHDRWNELER